MAIDDTQLHFPDSLGAGDILTIQGEIACALCLIPLRQEHVDRGELIAMTGAGAKGTGTTKSYRKLGVELASR